MIKRKTRRGILLLAALAILSWLATREPADPGESRIAVVDTRLNYALFDFEARLLDDRGRINLELTSPRLRKNASTGIGTVESPTIHIRHEIDDWHITSESAIITPDNEHVSLMGDVNMLRTRQTTGETTIIVTRDVMLNVTPRTASTESPVSIEQAGDRLEAVGMNLDMINDSFELLDDVRAHYATP